MRRLTLFTSPIVIALIFVLFLPSIQTVQAATYYVDSSNCPGPGTGTMGDPFCSIQSGINAASSGDTVQVAPGTYYEKITMKSGVVIQGAGQDVSTIDGGGSGTVVTAIDVDSTAMLDGFTITGGLSDYGAGMYNKNSSPTVINCTFSGNSANYGGGMYNSYSSPTVTNCTFSGNTAAYASGGMYNTDSSPTVTNCTFSGNTAGLWGGAMNNSSSSPTMTNCIFSGNTAGFWGGAIENSISSPTMTNCIFSGNTAVNYGGAMENFYYSWPTLTNCIFFGNSADQGGGMANDNYSSPTLTNTIMWGDNPEEIYNSNSSPVVNYSDIEGAYAGTGNINADPLFVDPDGPDNIPGNEDDDYHLLAGSPCIDTGTSSGAPDTDFENNPRPQGAGYDMGAYEFLLAKTTAMPWIPLLLLDD